MKKLMFSAVAALAASVSFGLESANIVGYAANSLKSGCTMATPQFLSIDTSDMPLQSIKPIGDNASDNIYIQTLDAAGRTLTSYAWNDWSFDTPCWVDDDYAMVEGVTIAPGQGLWVQGLSSTQSIQTSGEVGQSDVTVLLRSGCTATGNPFPVTFDLQDIVATGADASDNIYIQTLDAAGRTLTNYAWNDWSFDAPCWVDDDYAMVEGVTIAPGQGLWVQGLSSEQAIRFPAPEL